MWQGKSSIQARPKISHTYTSKVISQLMDSNSDAQSQNSQPQLQPQYENQQQQQPLFQYRYQRVQQKQRIRNTNSIPPLASILDKQNYNNNIVVSKSTNTNTNIAKNKNDKISKNLDYTRQTRQRKQNRQSKDIKYNCFKVQGNKLVQINQVNQYNSLNLEDTSIIKSADELLSQQLQKLKQQSKQKSQKLKQLQNQNKLLKRQLNLTKQQLQSKDNYYQQIQLKLSSKQKQLNQLHKKYQSLELQNRKFQTQSIKYKSMSQQAVGGRKRQGQLSQYISNKMKNSLAGVDGEGENLMERVSGGRRNTEVSQKIYGDVCKYIVARVQQLKNKLVSHRMSKAIEDMIQQFMTQIININPITVSRVVQKSRLSTTPTRSYTNLLTEQPSSSKNPTTTNSMISKQSQVFQFQTQSQSQSQSKFQSITPPKRQQQQPTKQKSQLLNLQKSLQKLRDMQKSFISNSPNITQGINKYDTSANDNNYKDSYNSLDRSSIMDRSNRSKSRRKKIFE